MNTQLLVAEMFAGRSVRPVSPRVPLAALLLALLGVLIFPAGLVGAALGVWALGGADARLPVAQRRQAVATIGVGVPVFTFSALATPFVLHALGLLARVPHAPP